MKYLFLSLFLSLSLLICAGSQAQNAYSGYSFDNVLWVDGIKYTTLASCYAAIGSNGGVCMVPPNYGETLSSNLVLNKNFAGFVFTGPASITMGSNQVTMAGGVNGDFLIGTASGQGAGQVVWNYTGSGNALQFGDIHGATEGLTLTNQNVNLASAGNSAVGFYLTEVRGYKMDYPTCNHSGGSNSQVCVVLDGTGLFTAGVMTYPVFTNAPFTGIKFTGSGGNNANANTVIGGGFPNGCSSATGATGLNFVHGTGNTVINMDLEFCATGVAFGNASDASTNVVSIWQQSNTTDVSFGAASFNNQVTLMTTGGVAGAIVQAGTNNRVYSGSALVSGGPSNVVYNTPSAATTTSIGATTMVTVPTASAGTYRLNFYVTETALGTSCRGTTGLLINWIWTDPNGSSSITGGYSTINLGITGNGSVGAIPGETVNTLTPMVLRAKAGTNLQYSTTYLAGVGCAPGPQYQVYPIVEQLN